MSSFIELLLQDPERDWINGSVVVRPYLNCITDMEEPRLVNFAKNLIGCSFKSRTFCVSGVNNLLCQQSQGPFVLVQSRTFCVSRVKHLLCQYSQGPVVLVQSRICFVSIVKDLLCSSRTCCFSIVKDLLFQYSQGPFVLVWQGPVLLVVSRTCLLCQYSQGPVCYVSIVKDLLCQCCKVIQQAGYKPTKVVLFRMFSATRIAVVLHSCIKCCVSSVSPSQLSPPPQSCLPRCTEDSPQLKLQLTQGNPGKPGGNLRCTLQVNNGSGTLRRGTQEYNFTNVVLSHLYCIPSSVVYSATQQAGVQLHLPPGEEHRRGGGPAPGCRQNCLWR